MSYYNNLTFIATTTNREICFQSLVISIRRVFGYAPKILFTHQIDSLTQSMKDFSSRYGVTSFATGYDSGLSYNRNYMLNFIETDFFVLCDDDFIFDLSVRIDLGLELMNSYSIDMLGGVYKNFNFDKNNILKSYNESSFAFNIELNFGSLKKHSVDLSKCNSFKGMRFIACDCINNFSIMRIQPFINDPTLRWDDEMKISGEHIDFFTKNKIKGIAKVCFSPDLSVLHVRRSNPLYREMRNRREGLKIFESKIKKWYIV